MTTVRAWACVTEERFEKAGRLMEAVQDGWPGVATVIGAPPEDGRPFFCWGQMWLTLSLVPRAIKIGRPFWQIDNGPVFPPLNGEGGFHRFCYRSLSMIMLRDAPERSLAAATAENFRPWRSDGRHVLIALPGIGFGQAVGLDMREYYATVLDQVQAVTDRPIKIRPKRTRTPIDKDLTNCWALVTHSSNVAVDAVIRGIPVFVAPTNPAAAVGNLDLADIERPSMPERMPWWRSLWCQQFSLDEIQGGVAYRFLQLVEDQVEWERANEWLNRSNIPSFSAGNRCAST